MLAGVRDRLLLHDPCFARLIYASRAVMGLAAVAILGALLARELGLELSGVLLGIVGAQFSLLLAREPTRKVRIITSLFMIPGYWLGLIIVHVVADQPSIQIVILPMMLGLGFWFQNSRSRLATMIIAAAWMFMFTIYFGAQDGSLTWQMVAVSVSILVMMLLRFVIWSDDRPASTFLILRSHQLILIRAAQRAAKSKHTADALGWLHKSMVPVVQSLANHPGIDVATHASLVNQQRAVEIELLRAPGRGLEIAKALASNSDVGCLEALPGSDALDRTAGSREVHAKTKKNTVQSSSADISRVRALQVTVAVMPAALAGFLISPERWPWAVLVAMFMFFGTENSGRLLSKGVENVIGVIVGIFIALGLSYVLPPLLALEFAVIMMLTFLAFYLIPVHYAAGMAVVTALIGQALALSGDDFALLLQLRLTEVLAGAAFGLFAGLCVMPERASDKVRGACATFLNDVANVLDPDQAGVEPRRLISDLTAAYNAADFDRLAGLLIDGASMRAALVEMAQLLNLTERYRHLNAQSSEAVPPHFLYELASRCRTTAKQVVNRRRGSLVPLTRPENAAPELGVLAAIDTSLQAISRQS